MNDGHAAYSAPTTHRRADIQGLRALAVILVILAHAKFSLFRGGYIGVDVFFVISGFVITGLLLRQPEGQVFRNLGTFYARRIRRILPAATVTLIATMAAAFAVIGPFNAQPLLTDVRWASLFGANFRFISVGTDYFAQGLPQSLITHFWSLAVEEQFYFVFPLVLFVSLSIFGLRRHRVALGVFLTSLVAASAVWSVMQTNNNPVVAYFSPFTRFWELGVGALLAVLPVATIFERTPRVLRVTATWISLGGVLATAMLLTDASAVPGWLTWWAVAPTGVLLLLGGDQVRWSVSGLLSLRPVTYVGDISYSLYLFHFAWLNTPVQYALLNYSHEATLSLTSRLAQIAGALGCAIISYHVIENPIRRARFLDRRPWLTIPLAGLCIGATWLCAWLIATYWTL